MKTLVRIAKLLRLAYPIGAFKFWIGTRRSALATICDLESKNIIPRTIIDAGCNRSQWSRWLSKKYPDAKIHSIDVQNLNPLGKFHHFALGDRNDMVRVTLDGKSSHVSECGTLVLKQKRLDDLGIEIQEPCVLKIDCESSTLQALMGSTRILDRCCAVVIEMANLVPEHKQNNNQMEIVLLMNQFKFSRMECVDASVWPWRVFCWDALFVKDLAVLG